MNLAIMTDDPLERFKLVMTALVSINYQSDEGGMFWHKPLNPIIGETFAGFYRDGTTCFAEQISHHPTIPYFLVYGPDNAYTFHGYSNYKVKVGLNSAKISNSGKKVVTFKNG